MTFDEFEFRVRTHAPPDIPPDVREMALSGWKHARRIEQNDVNHCIVYMGDLNRWRVPGSSRRSGERGRTQRSSLRGSEARQVTLVRDRLLASISPYVRDLRTRNFGAPTPPFGDLKKAWKWVRKEATDYPHWPRGIEVAMGSAEPLPQSRQRVLEEIRGVVGEAKRLISANHIDIRIDYPRPRVFTMARAPTPIRVSAFLKWAREQDRTYYRRLRRRLKGKRTLPGTYNPDLWDRVHAPANTPLEALQEGAERLSSATFLREHEVTAHLLTGIPPTLPLARLETESTLPLDSPDRAERRTTRAVVFFHAPGVTHQEILELRRDVDSLLLQLQGAPEPRKGAKRAYPSERAQQLILMVDEMGGEPPGRKGQQAFWTGALERFNTSRAEDRKYKDWRSLRQLYRRNRAKLEPKD